RSAASFVRSVLFDFIEIAILEIARRLVSLITPTHQTSKCESGLGSRGALRVLADRRGQHCSSVGGRSRKPTNHVANAHAFEEHCMPDCDEAAGAVQLRRDLHAAACCRWA